MREIKFRGKTTDEVGDRKIWIYGDLLQGCEICDICEISDCESIDGTRYQVEQNSIGQYTGLKDKNEKEIYEGDIILTQPFRDKPYSKKSKEKRLKGIVEYNVLSGAGFGGDTETVKYWGAEWNVRIVDKDYSKYGCYDWGKFWECEVIGNIYENPELLEESDIE